MPTVRKPNLGDRPVRHLTSYRIGVTAEADRRRLIHECLRALAGVEVIYAIRCTDGLIKVGWSRNIRNRRRSFTSDPLAILMVTPGTVADEQAAHEHLAPHLARGQEYYHATPEVLAWVNAHRQRLGVAAAA